MLPVLLKPTKHFCYTKNGLIIVPKMGQTDSVHTVLCLLRPMLCIKYCNMFVSFCHQILSLSFNSQEEWPPILGCPQLFVQYSCSCRPFTKGCLLHPNLKTGHDVDSLVMWNICPVVLSMQSGQLTPSTYLKDLYFSHISRNVRTAGHLNVRALLLFKNQ